MFKRTLAGIAVIAAAVAIAPSPAQAIPPGDTLMVIAYFNDSAITN
jgi:K+/H+ antiporter YhaU regulatory subunit KhtT